MDHVHLLLMKKDNKWHPVIRTQVVGTSVESPHQLRGFEIRHRPFVAKVGIHLLDHMLLPLLEEGMHEECGLS